MSTQSISLRYSRVAIGPFAVALLTVTCVGTLLADDHTERLANDQPSRAYQRRAQGQPYGRSFRRPGHARRFAPSFHQSQSAFFQRPYPYHLDYYRMKYGGSYAPYFGNLYGTPNVYAPVYAGGAPYVDWQPGPSYPVETTAPESAIGPPPGGVRSGTRPVYQRHATSPALP